MSWWEEQCPKRGPALHHAHSTRCDPEYVHPHDDTGNEGNHHPAHMCCHCQMTRAMAEAEAEAIEARTSPSPRLEEHEYMKSLTGRCVRNGCGRREEEHITFGYAEPGKCPVKHSSITQTSISIGDGGLQWKTCPGCNTQIEPRMALGEPQGAADGLGRGWISPRMFHRWENIARENRT